MTLNEQRDLINKIKSHQKNQQVHPLTCGVDSRHSLLEGILLNGKVVLVCPDCGYIQKNIPPLWPIVKNRRKAK